MQSFSTFTKLSRPIPEKKNGIDQWLGKNNYILERMQAKPGVAEKVYFSSRYSLGAWGAAQPKENFEIFTLIKFLFN